MKTSERKLLTKALEDKRITIDTFKIKGLMGNIYTFKKLPNGKWLGNWGTHPLRTEFTLRQILKKFDVI